jgi:hypothetical protein
MNHNKLTGSSTRSSIVLCFNSTVRPGFYQPRYFNFPLNVRDTPCDGSSKVTMKNIRGGSTCTDLHKSKILHLFGNKLTKTKKKCTKTKAKCTILIRGSLVFFKNLQKKITLIWEPRISLWEGYGHYHLKYVIFGEWTGRNNEKVNNKQPLFKKMPIIIWYLLIYYCSNPAEILGDIKIPGREQKLRHLLIQSSLNEHISEWLRTNSRTSWFSKITLECYLFIFVLNKNNRTSD